MKQFHIIDDVDRMQAQMNLFRLVASVQQLCDIEQVNHSAISGLKFFRLSSPDEPSRCFYEPCFAIILSGVKRVFFDGEQLLFHPGDFFLTSIDIPTSAHVVEANAERPYLSLILKLDLAMIQELSARIGVGEGSATSFSRGVATGKATDELLGALLRLVQLLQRPDDIPLLGDMVKAEIYVRLLQSEAGNWLRRMAGDGYRTTGVVRALEWLKSNYSKSLRIDQLAEFAGMATSTFHHNFRSLTGTSPLQYQKTLRLYAARNLMLAERVDANTAALRVGYESVQQFSREYARHFGAPPRRDVEQLRGR